MLVHLKHLKEVKTCARSGIWIGYQVSLRAKLIEVVLDLSIEETEYVIVELKLVLLVPDDRLQSFACDQWVIYIFHEVLYWILEVVNVELSADHHLNHRDLTDPLVKLGVIRTLGVRFQAPLENELDTAMHRSVEVTLQCEISRVRAVIVFDAKLLNLFNVWVEDILAELAS